jgi:hypothetical protein
MSFIVISSHNEIYNELRKLKFIINYSDLIKSKVSSIGTKQHNKTTTYRHLKRVTDKV